MEKQQKEFILWFDEIDKDDIPLVGGKNANLGELYQHLTKNASHTFPEEKIQVPFGFAVTAYAYRYFIQENKLDAQIKHLFKELDTRDISHLEEVGSKVRELILSAPFPSELEEVILTAYHALQTKLGSEVTVAVRSSATAEDLPEASFAGQQESYLHIRGEHNLLETIKKSFSSLFTNRAISYRVDQKYDHFKIALSVGVQQMVRSDRGASGVMFTLDTDTGFRNVVLINGAWGLGEFVVKGIVTPDEFMVFKPTLKKGFHSIISKKLGSKEKKLIYSTEGTDPTNEVQTSFNERQRFVISEDIVLQLAKWGVMIEEHYQKPMDIEWAYDAKEKQLFIVQARPETVEARKDVHQLEEYVLLEKSKILAHGASVGRKIGQGKAHFIKDPSELAAFKKGEVLLAEMTDPDCEPIMKLASAIVTNSGGRTSHAAIVSRELGIPAIVGTGTATKDITNGQDITVSCADGEVGNVYEGLLQFRIDTTDLSDFSLPKTDLKMIVANPELAFNYSFIPNRGVGLAREEFIIMNTIKIHPNALLHYDKLDDATKQQIDALTIGYEDKVAYYVDKLAYGISMIAAAFYPNEVLLRFSDFKSNEYANLIGGKQFEPHEENPMLGWRGASRYYDPLFSDAFALECRAVKKVREEMGLDNLQVMIPFCRTPEEGKKVLKEMEKNGLRRYKDFHVWMMAEIPSNILQADEFAKLFDGFSIGSNDLTQLLLGLDRDSKLVANIGNENSFSVHVMIAKLIEEAHRARLKVGICGQGPSDFPQFCELLVQLGIDSISLSPDTLLKTAVAVKKIENEMAE